MAKQAKFVQQMPFVGTETQKAIVDREEAERETSKAAVVREAFDHYWGLVDGELPQGQTELPERPVHLRPEAVRQGHRMSPLVDAED